MKLSLLFFSIPLIITLISIFAISKSFSPIFSQGDFRAQYAGAYLVNKGHAKDLYDLDMQLVAQQVSLPTLKKAQALPFYSPPVIALILSPLGHFSFANAFIIFSFSQMLLLFASLVVMAYSLDEVAKKKHVRSSILTRWHLLILVSGLSTIWMNILHGQLAAFWLFIIVSAWVTLQKKQDVFTGILLSVLFLKLHLIIIPIILFASIKKWRVLLGIFLGMTIISFISLYMIGVEGVSHYFNFLIHLSGMERTYGVNTSYQTTLLGVISYVLVGGYSQIQPSLPFGTLHIWFVLSLILSIRIILLWLRIPNTQQTLKLKFAHMIALMLFTSIHTHTYDMSLLFFALILCINYVLSKTLYSTKLRDPIFARYILLSIVLLIATLTLSISVFPPSSIIIYALFFYFIEKEYGKIHKAHEIPEKK